MINTAKIKLFLIFRDATFLGPNGERIGPIFKPGGGSRDWDVVSIGHPDTSSRHRRTSALSGTMVGDAGEPAVS